MRMLPCAPWEGSQHPPLAQSGCRQGVRLYPSTAADFPEVPSPAFGEVQAQGDTLCLRREEVGGKAEAQQFGSGQ